MIDTSHLKQHKSITIGECLSPAMDITNSYDARVYFDALVDYYVEINLMENKPVTRELAIDIAKSNLGYYAGYYDRETAVRVQELFKCVHPIFGKTEPTPEEAFKMGQDMAMNGIKSVEQPEGVPKKPGRTVLV